MPGPSSPTSPKSGKSSSSPSSPSSKNAKNSKEELSSDDPDGEGLPSIDFTTFVTSLAHSALVHLGEAPAPEGHVAETNFQLARQTIDLLGVLEEKTKGNLTGHEERILAHNLDELRTRFVERSKASRNPAPPVPGSGKK